MQAAALSAPTKSLPQDDEAEPELPRRARFGWVLPLVSLIAAIAVVVGGWFGWKWSQTQYYVLGKDGAVVIYQGIPQSIGSWNLSHAVEITDVKLDQLAAVDQQRLQEPVTRTSRSDIDAYVSVLRSNARERALEKEREAKQQKEQQEREQNQNNQQGQEGQGSTGDNSANSSANPEGGN